MNKEIKNVPRPETGTMQFGNDWPGVFIRGDNAVFYASCLSLMLRASREGKSCDPLTEMYVEGFISLLTSSDIRNRPVPQLAQLLEQSEETCE